MIVTREILGNIAEQSDLRGRYERRGTFETVVVSERERNRSRFKTELTDGTELGVVLGEQQLSPGDVLVEDDERMVVVEFERREALVVSVPEIGWKEALELGQHIGNQHWELALRGGDLLIPITGERRLMERTLREALPPSAQIAVETVDPELLDVNKTSHDHRHDHGHNHSHDNAHSHDSDHSHTDHGDTE